MHSLSSYPDINNSLKMEVGIEDSLHIEFEYNKSKYVHDFTLMFNVYFILLGIVIFYAFIQVPFA